MFVISKQPEQTQIASFLKKWKWECSPSSEYKRHFMPSQKPHDFSFFLKLTVHWLPNQSSLSKCKHSLMKFWLIWSTAKLDLWWEVYSRDDKTRSTNKCWFRFLQIWVTTWLALWHNGGRIASICIFHHYPLIFHLLAFWLFGFLSGWRVVVALAVSVAQETPKIGRHNMSTVLYSLIYRDPNSLSC